MTEDKTICLCGKLKASWQEECCDCKTTRRYASAKIVEAPGPYWDERGDQMFDEVDEFLDSIQEIDPEETYELFCTRIIEWDPLDIIECAIEASLTEHHEDAFDQLVDYKGLVQFVAEWSKKQSVSSYEVDYTRKIRISKEEIDNYIKETKC